MDPDIVVKKAQFIEKSVEIRTDPESTEALPVLLLQSHAGEKARQVYNAWNTAVKLSWGCPRKVRLDKLG